jgi:hypothetical protein
MPVQLDTSVVVEYWPDLQSMHSRTAFLYLPATQAVVHTCASLAALERNVPLTHVLSVHAELSVSVEYLPDPQGAQNVSADAVPAASPCPAGQLGAP